MAQYGRKAGKRGDGREEGRSGKLVKPFLRADGWRSPPNRERAITPPEKKFQTIPKKLSDHFFSLLPMSVSYFPVGARRFPRPLSASPLHGKALSGLTDWPAASETLSGSFLCKSTKWLLGTASQSESLHFPSQGDSCDSEITAIIRELGR